MPHPFALGLASTGLALGLWAGSAAGQYHEISQTKSSSTERAVGRWGPENPIERTSFPETQAAGSTIIGEQPLPTPGAAVMPPVPMEHSSAPPEPLPDPRHTLARKGNPQNVAWYALPTDTPSYIGYYVGGGATCGGEPRFVNEGTWGWDYQGWLVPRRVVLAWWHGRRCQGGVGHYRTVLKPSVKSQSTP